MMLMLNAPFSMSKNKCLFIRENKGIVMQDIIRSPQDDKILSMLEGQEEYELYKEMLYLRKQLISPPPMMIPFFSCAAIDKNGRIEDEREGLMHTWLRNYSNMFAMLVCGLAATGAGSFEDGELNVKQISGAISSASSIHNFADIQADFGEVDRGILIGRGPAAYSYEDFVLDNQIDHGITGSEMLYYDMFNHVQTWVGGGTRQWTSIIKRYFVNRSSGAIGVTEAALARNSVIMSRDIVSPTVTINIDKACRVTYTLVSVAWAS